MEEEGIHISHTTTVDIKFKNKEAVVKAATLLNATILGEGTHRLFSSNETGLALKLPSWHYPMVIHQDGTVAFDNYNGAWGNIKDLDRFKELYATEAVKAQCDVEGWYYEQNPQTLELTIHHPDGGIINVSPQGTVEASNFVGSACDTATAKLEEVIGTRLESVRKPDYNLTQLKVNEVE